MSDFILKIVAHLKKLHNKLANTPSNTWIKVAIAAALIIIFYPLIFLGGSIVGLGLVAFTGLAVMAGVKLGDYLAKQHVSTSTSSIQQNQKNRDPFDLFPKKIDFYPIYMAVLAIVFTCAFLGVPVACFLMGGIGGIKFHKDIIALFSKAQYYYNNPDQIIVDLANAGAKKAANAVAQKADTLLNTGMQYVAKPITYLTNAVFSPVDSSKQTRGFPLPTPTVFEVPCENTKMGMLKAFAYSILPGAKIVPAPQKPILPPPHVLYFTIEELMNSITELPNPLFLHTSSNSSTDEDTDNIDMTNETLERRLEEAGINAQNNSQPVIEEPIIEKPVVKPIAPLNHRPVQPVLHQYPREIHQARVPYNPPVVVQKPNYRERRGNYFGIMDY